MPANILKMARRLDTAESWHKQEGTFPINATFDQIAEACGFDFEIVKSPVLYNFNRNDNTGTTIQMTRQYDGKFVFHRNDDGTPLAINTSRYKDVQPRDVLEFFSEVCELQGWQINTAGVLGSGEKYWCLADTNIETNLSNGSADIHNFHVLLATSIDGSLATIATGTDTRVVCQNTLQLAVRNAGGDAIKVRHNTDFDAKRVQANLGMVDFDQTWEAAMGQLRKLQEVEISRDEATEFFSDLLRPDRIKDKDNVIRGNFGADSSTKSITERAIRGLSDLENSYMTAPGADPGTAYGLVQGVSHFVDHVRGKSQEKRLSSSMFGQGNTLKQKAMEQALELAA